jgi:hypothetical protein
MDQLKDPDELRPQKKNNVFVVDPPDKSGVLGRFTRQGYFIAVCALRGLMR